jgi:hypothetical protein
VHPSPPAAVSVLLSTGRQCSRCTKMDAASKYLPCKCHQIEALSPPCLSYFKQIGRRGGCIYSYSGGHRGLSTVHPYKCGPSCYL